MGLRLLQRTVPACLLALALLPGGAPAASGQAAKDGRAPALITGDTLSHDRARGRIVASGNVTVSQGGRTVRADRIDYDLRARRIVALGNVSIAEPGGETVFGDRIELTDDLRDGLIERFGMLFPDMTRIAANGARRTGGRRTEMAQVVFSPCKLCAEDPTRPPLWRIRARRVVHDQETRDIEYRDAWFEFHGVPVLYTPYLRHPDPTVYRRSGFLTPTFGTGKQLGVWAKIPYYWRIGPDRDATITPLIATREHGVLFAEYRQRFEKGAATLAGSYTHRPRADFEIAPDGSRSRGHFFGRFRYDIDRFWRFGLDGNWTADDTYLRRYDIARTDSLHSSAWLEGFHDRNYTAFRLHHFQGLRIDDSYRTTPLVAPYIEHERFGRPGRNAGRWHFRFSTVSLSRREGTDSYRTSVNLGWRLPYIHRPTGIVLAGTLDLFADGYYAQDVERPGASPYSGFASRAYPAAELEMRYPLVRELGNTRLILEPRAALIASLSGLNSSKIPNEDSLDLELDDTSLFAANRFPGRDRIDDGSRLVYGITATFLGNRGGQSDLFLGQSLRIGGRHQFDAGSGLGNTISDLVGRLHVNPGRYLDLVYRFRLAPDSFRAYRNEVTLNAGAPALNVSVGYLLFQAHDFSGEIPSREELAFTARSQVTKRWSVFGGGRWNLTMAGGNLNWQAGGRFSNECCSFRIAIGQSFTRDRDIRPSTNVLFTLSLKHLGRIGGDN